MFSSDSNSVSDNSYGTFSDNIIFRHSILYISVNTTDSNQGRHYRGNLHGFTDYINN